MSSAGVIHAIMEVARQRKAVLERLRAALESGNNDQALELARQLCGIGNEESNRTDSRLN